MMRVMTSMLPQWQMPTTQATTPPPDADVSAWRASRNTLKSIAVLTTPTRAKLTALSATARSRQAASRRSRRPFGCDAKVMAHRLACSLRHAEARRDKAARLRYDRRPSAARFSTEHFDNPRGCRLDVGKRPPAAMTSKEPAWFQPGYE